MTAILGISALYHDSAAALVIDGTIVAAAQQERFTRVKHDPSFPDKAIEYCLGEANLCLEQLDAIVFYDKPMLKFERLLETYLGHAPFGFQSFLRSMPVWLKEKLYFKSLLRRELRALVHKQRAEQNGTSVAAEKKRDKRPGLPTLLFTEHHQSHAASAFFASPFEQAVVLSLDGVGEWATSSMWLGKGNTLTPLAEIHFPHSLGLLYSAFTYYCGFKVNSGEYKLMGLAPYGEPRFVDTILEHLITLFEDGSFALNLDYFDYSAGASMINKKFESLFGHPRFDDASAPTQLQMDIARSIQEVTEQVVLKMAHHAFNQTGVTRLCLAGGVALNCVANGRILREGPFEDIWIQPAAGDAGGALGAALMAWHGYFDGQRQPELPDSMRGAQLGPSYSNEDVVAQLELQKVPFHYLNDDTLFAHVAQLLANEQVVGWFQGRAEFGPRALGNRSILGDPRSASMQRQMNLKIKQRESFRPFAPAVLEQDVSNFFNLDKPSPYMLLVADVDEKRRQPKAAGVSGLAMLESPLSDIPAITHVDYSARVQTVDSQRNSRFYALIEAFKQHTGLGILINTSFNVRGEPPVLSVDDALRCFWATDMDVLVVGNCVLMKAEQRAADIERAKAVTFEED
ncbi:carbamoyltransferase [Aestuariibacter salexigens]|uniref:carbamoyltransferase family protein n=1 Tax=Aestuariibacter salexigens TaxID=226010 RepID=UPI0003F62F78|nr:carbamoyltransferase [Aestuariibacter salexigens]